MVVQHLPKGFERGWANGVKTARLLWMAVWFALMALVLLIFAAGEAGRQGPTFLWQFVVSGCATGLAALAVFPAVRSGLDGALSPEQCDGLSSRLLWCGHLLVTVFLVCFLTGLEIPGASGRLVLLTGLPQALICYVFFRRLRSVVQVLRFEGDRTAEGGRDDGWRLPPAV